jgi:hypothetical protein
MKTNKIFERNLDKPFNRIRSSTVDKPENNVKEGSLVLGGIGLLMTFIGFWSCLHPWIGTTFTMVGIFVGHRNRFARIESGQVGGSRPGTIAILLGLSSLIVNCMMFYVIYR